MSCWSKYIWKTPELWTNKRTRQLSSPSLQYIDGYLRVTPNFSLEIAYRGTLNHLKVLLLIQWGPVISIWWSNSHSHTVIVATNACRTLVLLNSLIVLLSMQCNCFLLWVLVWWQRRLLQVWCMHSCLCRYKRVTSPRNTCSVFAPSVENSLNILEKKRKKKKRKHSKEQHTSSRLFMFHWCLFLQRVS